MPSAFNPVVNTLKYSKIDPHNGSGFVPTKEMWANNGGWVEPKQVWVNKAGTWTKATNETRHIVFDGTSTRLMQGTSSYFNTYGNKGTGAGTGTFQLIIGLALKGAGTQRTLFCYGAGLTTSYMEAYIGTDNKLYFISRYNGGTAYSVAHATALAVDTYYKIYISYCYVASAGGWGYRLALQIRDIAGAVVGTDVYSNNVTAYTTASYKKSIGQRYFGNTMGALGTNLFNGVMFGIYIKGFDYTTDTSTQITDEQAFEGSTVGSTTVTDTWSWTIYGGATLQSTG